MAQILGSGAELPWTDTGVQVAGVAWTGAGVAWTGVMELVSRNGSVEREVDWATEVLERATAGALVDDEGQVGLEGAIPDRELESTESLGAALTEATEGFEAPVEGREDLACERGTDFSRP